MRNYGILINTCDKFNDCWKPFFKLFAFYWPNCSGSLYLNTELEEFNYSNLDIKSLRVAIDNQAKTLTWSECLLKALDKIDEEIILYMQEDYFINSQVRDHKINEFVELMSRNHDIDCIHLTDVGPQGNQIYASDNRLRIVPLIHKDRICCQAALWRKKTLQQYIRTHESAWNFEWFGSKRSQYYHHNFYSVDRQLILHKCDAIIPYIATGVIGGRWHKEIPKLFNDHQIHIDYSIRGFFIQQEKKLLERLKSKMKRFPVEFRSNIELLLLRLRGNR